MPSFNCRLLFTIAGAALLLSACSGSGNRSSLAYANVWDQAFAQSMKQPKKAGGGS